MTENTCLPRYTIPAIQEAIKQVASSIKGVHKSHLAQAIGHAVIRSGQVVYYRSIFNIELRGRNIANWTLPSVKAN